MAFFRVDWLGEDAKILQSTHLDKEDLISAGNSCCHRWLRSYHLIPDNCRGFYLTPLSSEGGVLTELKIEKSLEPWEIEYEKAKAEGFGYRPEDDTSEV